MPRAQLAIALLACAPVVTQAQVAVVAKAGTLGVGADLVVPILASANARVGANWFANSRDFDKNGIDYDGKIQLRSAALLGDWFPMAASGFRVSGGVMYNGNRGKLDAKPQANATYVFNGTTYQASDVASANGEVSWARIAPYLGIGWGNPVARTTDWSFNFDVGVMFQRAPKVRLSASCNPALPAVQCQQLQDSVVAEETKLRDDYKSFRFYPVVSVGVGRKF